jgi:antirestriction protein ArdC
MKDEVGVDEREGFASYASYIASWIKVLKDDKRAIFSAACKRNAQRIICTACKRQRRLNPTPREILSLRRESRKRFAAMNARFS